MAEDLTGQRFGRWTVIGRSDRKNNQGRAAYLFCRCDCGAERDVQRCGLVTGGSQSCGCLQRERVSGPKKTPTMMPCMACGSPFRVYPSDHRKYCSRECASKSYTRANAHGMSRSRLYGIWCGMKTRCNPASSTAPEYYSARNITVCSEWRESFEAFRDWALANGYGPRLEIDRIENDQGYSPANCRWATRRQQMQNTRKRKDAKTSRFKGVSWCSNAGKWRAQIQYLGKPHHLGLFDNEEDAAKAYDLAARRRFGSYSHLNFKEVHHLSS